MVMMHRGALLASALAVSTVLAVGDVGAARGATARTTPAKPASARTSARTASPPTSAVGTDFWLSFLPNLDQTSTPVAAISVVAASAGKVNVSGGGLLSPITRHYTTGSPLDVQLPIVGMTDDTVAAGYHVTATTPVSLYAQNDDSDGAADATIVMPSSDLGNDYVAATYSNFTDQLTAESAIVATTDHTTITVTPTINLGTGRTQGVPFTRTLDRGQVYPIRVSGSGTTDFSGTTITSDHPVAVFGGHQCAQVPVGAASCGHLFEQLTPTSEWGRDLIVVPTATRSADRIKLFGGADGATLSYLPSAPAGAPTTLSAGQVVEFSLSTPVQVVASSPIQALNYGESGFMDDQGQDDPTMMSVPPVEQYLAAYTIATQLRSEAESDFAAVSIPAKALGSLRLDGAVVSQSGFAAIAGTKFAAGSLPLTAGRHSLTASSPFGLQVYGYPTETGGSFVGFGMVGGMNLSRIADVTAVSVTPSTSKADVGASKCVTITARDSSGSPLPGVRIDVAMTGANRGSTFVFANSTGHASYCSTGTAVGRDTITARVGSISGTAALTRQVARLTHLTVHAASAKATLSWTNPNKPLFPTTVIVRRTSGKTPASGPTAGTAAYSGNGTGTTVQHLGAGRTWTFATWARDGTRRLSARVSVTVTGTTISAHAPPHPVTAGTDQTLNMTLQAVGHTGAPVGRSAVALTKRTSSGWKTLSRTSTDSRGKATAKVRITKSASFRWTFAGGGRLLGSKSPVVAVAIRH